MADGNQGPLDSFYVEKNKIIIWVLCFVPCVSCIMLIMNLICFFTAKNPESKNIAKIGLIIAACLVIASFALNFVIGGFAFMAGGR